VVSFAQEQALDHAYAGGCPALPILCRLKDLVVRAEAARQASRQTATAAYTLEVDMPPQYQC
jgi:hypothetical protein